jgi:RNA polymerase sigma factor (TIGR02999 family)
VEGMTHMSGPSQEDDAERASGASRWAGRLTPDVYADLRRLAHSRLAGGGHTLLDTTALVHESFLRLQRAGSIAIADRDHFLAYAASSMRSIIVDYVRRRGAERRGGGAAHVTLNTGVACQLGATDGEIVEVHDALETLAEVDPRLVRIVEMRYFAGMTDLEIGRVLGVTDRTVRRDWERARLLLAGLLER